MTYPIIAKRVTNADRERFGYEHHFHPPFHLVRISHWLYPRDGRRRCRCRDVALRMASLEFLRGTSAVRAVLSLRAPAGFDNRGTFVMDARRRGTFGAGGRSRS